jgi:hypothetical protein
MHAMAMIRGELKDEEQRIALRMFPSKESSSDEDYSRGGKKGRSPDFGKEKGRIGGQW